MAKTEVLLLTLLLIPAVGAVNFQIEIPPEPDTVIRGLDFAENTSSYEEINASVENTGSVGCEYRMEAEFNQNGTRHHRVSQALPLQPGEVSAAELYYLPYNYTGNVTADIEVSFCGEREEVEKITFNSTRANTVNNSIDSRTLEADKNRAKIQLETEEALLIPQKTPRFWKAAAERVSKGETVVRYDPPIFQKGEELTYAVVNESSGELIGTTKVKLEDNPTPLYMIKENKWKLGLAASFLLNILLLTFAALPLLKNKVLNRSALTNT